MLSERHNQAEDRVDEWVVYLSRSPFDQLINVAAYSVAASGQLGFIDSYAFGPTDTATDVLRWLLRHLGPRMRLPLR